MTESNSIVNTIAPLVNVGLCMNTLQMAMNAPAHLPRLVSFSGPSGYGKSFAAAYCANKTQAYYVQAKSSWTKKAFLGAVLREMGIQPAKTIYEMTDQIAEQLVLSGRPLIVDEMDHIIEKNAVEIIRDIYEGSSAAILLIGEELLPTKLKRWERMHGRILHWGLAQPASIEDARVLARLYCRDIAIADDLLTRMVELAHGSVRRIVVNLERVREECLTLGRDDMDLDIWGRRDLYTGEAPKRRVA